MDKNSSENHLNVLPWKELFFFPTVYCTYRCSSSKGYVVRLPLDCNCLQSLATWETENKMTCRQTLVDGNGPKTYWTRELKGNELILVRTFTISNNKITHSVYVIVYSVLKVTFFNLLCDF